VRALVNLDRSQRKRACGAYLQLVLVHSIAQVANEQRVARHIVKAVVSGRRDALRGMAVQGRLMTQEGAL
jgi:hypothetical protein